MAAATQCPECWQTIEPGRFHACDEGLKIPPKDPTYAAAVARWETNRRMNP